MSSLLWTTGTMGGIAIVRASWRDSWGIFRLGQRVFGRDAWSLPEVAMMFLTASFTVFKALDQNRLVGFAAIELKPGNGFAWISTVGVDPAFRRQGVGTRLMDACEAAIPFKRVRLTVRVDNDVAQAVYYGRGYYLVRQVHRYYSGNMDGYVMEKVLN